MKIILATTFMLILFACAPVLRESLMKQGTLDVRFPEIKQNLPENKGRLFILGGIIVKTTVTEEGSLIEAIHVRVNPRGYLKSPETSEGRFLALFRNELLDPFIYSEKREITIAGELVDVRKRKIGEMEYTYPLFEIKDIHLWEDIKEMYYYYPYPPVNYRYFRHYPYYYPWWYY